jgi:hypothetical protein
VAWDRKLFVFKITCHQDIVLHVTHAFLGTLREIITTKNKGDEVDDDDDESDIGTVEDEEDEDFDEDDNDGKVSYFRLSLIPTNHF